MEISGLIAKIGVDLSEFERGIAKMQSRLEDTASKMATVGKKMSLMITAPITAIGIGSFKLYKDYESVVNKIVSLTDVSKEAWSSLEGQVKEIADTTGNSLKEVTEGFYFIASSGFKGAAALDILDKSAKAAASGLGSSADVSQLLTSVLQAYGEENISASKATDILIRSVKDGKAEASDMATNLGRILPVAAQMNVSFDQVSAAVAGLTLIGMDVPEAVTAIRGVLSEMLNMSEQGKQALLDMGTSYDELYNTLTTQGLLPFLQEIDKLVAQFGEQSIAKVFNNVRSLTGVLGLVGKNSEQVAAIFNDIANAGGDLDKAFENTQQTLEYKWNVAVDSAKGVLIELGTGIKGALVPVLNSLSNLLKGVSSFFSKLSDSTKTTIVVVGGLVAAIGPALLIGSQILKIVKSIIPLITTLKAGFVGLQTAVLSGTAGLKGFNLVFATLGNLAKANPFGLILTAATLLVPVISKLTSKHRELNEELEEQNSLQKEIDEATKNSTKELMQEQMHINNTVFKIISYNEGNIKRKDLLKKLQEEYPRYFGNLDIEKTSNEQLSKILKEVNADYEKRIKLMASEQEQKILIEKLAEAELKRQEILNQQSKIENDLNKKQKIGINITNSQVNSIEELRAEELKQQQNLNALTGLYDVNKNKLQELDSIIADYENRIKELMGTYDNLSESINTTNTATSNFNDTTKKATNELLDNWNKYIADLQSKFAILKTENENRGKDELTLLVEERLKVKNELDAQLQVWQDYLNNKKGITASEQNAINKLIAEGNALSLQLEQEYLKKIADLTPVQRIQATIGIDIEGDLQKQIDSYEQLKNAYNNSKISYEQYINAIVSGNYDLDTMIAKNEAIAKTMNELQNAAVSLFTGIAESIGGAIAGIKSFGEAILGTVMSVVKGLLQIAIAEAVRGIFSKSGIFATMGPAGIALMLGMSTMALAGITALQGQIQGLAEGGLVTKGGSFIVGERGREIVTLPAGSAVSPMHKNINSNIYLSGELSTRVRGEDLEFVLQRVEFKNKKR